MRHLRRLGRWLDDHWDDVGALVAAAWVGAFLVVAPFPYRDHPAIFVTVALCSWGIIIGAIIAVLRR